MPNAELQLLGVVYSRQLVYNDQPAVLGWR